jgi:RimJ/RimL family protein N-acetyltransferase
VIADAIPYPDPSLSGTTFLLRPFERGDFDAAAGFANDPATVNSVPPLPASDATGVLEFFEQYRRAGELLHLVIADREDDAYLGEVMLAVGEDRVGELGVGVVPGARSRGMATEAFCIFADWVARSLDLGRLQVLVAPENAAALRIAEHAGFLREGLLRSYWERDGERVDAVMLSLLPGAKVPASG